jgi:poly(A) polymerase
MNDLKLTEGPLVGKIKKAIEEAILDGEIDNDYESAYQFMIKTHKKMTSS